MGQKKVGVLLMLNGQFRFVLTLTSLSPVFGALGIVCYMKDKSLLFLAIHLTIMFSLFFICHRQMKHAANKKRTEYRLFIKEFNRRDQGMVTFLFVYLLPFLRSPDSFFTGGLLTGIYVLVIVFIAIVDVGAYNFNPVIRICGYRFYTVKDKENVPHLLIIKKNLREAEIEIPVHRISDDVWICKEAYYSV